MKSCHDCRHCAYKFYHATREDLEDESIDCALDFPTSLTESQFESAIASEHWHTRLATNCLKFEEKNPYLRKPTPSLLELY
jgi:hypothetical protein